MNKGIGLARFWLVLCSTLVLLPLLVVLTSFGEIDQEIWQFLLDYQLGLLLKHPDIANHDVRRDFATWRDHRMANGDVPVSRT